jgi:hypothetical protein
MAVVPKSPTILKQKKNWRLAEKNITYFTNGLIATAVVTYLDITFHALHRTACSE